MKRTLTIVVVASFLFVQISMAEVFKWVDEKGAVHFTDDVTQIPDKYRPKTEKMGIPNGRSAPGSESKAENEGVPSRQKEEAFKDRLGRGEDYWKEKLDSWKKKLAGALDEAENLRMKYNDLTEKLNASKSSAERATLRNQREQVRTELDKYKRQVEEARVMIEKKLPEEAKSYNAKPEWVKP